MKLNEKRLYLILVFTLATCMLFFIIGLVFKQFRDIEKNSETVYHTQNVALTIQKIYSNLKDIETERRNYILLGDYENEKNNVDRKVYENAQLLNVLQQKIKHPVQLKNLEELKKLISQKYKIVDATFAYKDPLDSHISAKTKELLLLGDKVMKQIKQRISKMSEVENKLLIQRNDIFLSDKKEIPAYLLLTSILALILIGTSFWKINSDLQEQQRVNNRLQISLDTSKIAEKVGKYGTWNLNVAKKEFSITDNFKSLLSQNNELKSLEDIAKNVFPDDLKMFYNIVDKIYKAENPEPFIIRIYDKDGNIKYLQNSTIKINQDGDLFIIGITRDITSDYLSEQELKEAYNDLEFYNESSKEAEKIGNYGFWEWIMDTNEFWFSDNFYRIYGLNPKNSISNLDDFLPYIHPEDLKLVLNKRDEVFRGDDVEPFVYRILRKNDSQLRYLSTRLKKTKNSVGQSSFIFITSDITDEVKYKNYLEEQNRVLDANNQELQAFNYVASHDLQEPLRKIEMFISRLHQKENENISEKGKDYLEKITSSAGRMRTLINDLLQFSRATKSEKIFAKTDLNQTFEEVKEELQNLIEEKKAKIVADELPSVEGISFQLKQLFTNIISNSLKYSKKDIYPEIKISYEFGNETAFNDYKLKPANYHRIEFEDNGIGFEEQYSEKIFHLFNRLHSKEEYSGTGIGLAICKKIIDNHSGYIFAKSGIGLGSNFIVFLPTKNI